MSRQTGFSIPVQILLWVTGNSTAGVVIGLAVGLFRGGGFDSTLVVLSVLFGNVVGLTVLGSSLVLFPRLRTLGPVPQAALLGLALVSGSVAGTAVVLYLFPLFVLRELRQAMAVTAINGVLALVVGGVVWAYEGLRLRLAETLREVEEVRLVEARLREDAARAELAALQARINPHFFFNTLNTICSLLPVDPARAEEVLQRLADLFRYTFKVADAGPVPLREELEFVEGYLRIEQARYGDRLRVVWDVSPEVKEFLVPGLLLQPLVENAVGHGIAPAASGGTVRIVALFEGEFLAIEVEDDGAGIARAPEALIEEGHGLGNVARRLRGVYGDRASLGIGTARHSDQRGTRVRLLLPRDHAGPPPTEGLQLEARTSRIP